MLRTPMAAKIVFAPEPAATDHTVRSRVECGVANLLGGCRRGAGDGVCGGDGVFTAEAAERARLEWAMSEEQDRVGVSLDPRGDAVDGLSTASVGRVRQSRGRSRRRVESMTPAELVASIRSGRTVSIGVTEDGYFGG
jgi:hypothetical protein